MNFHVLIIKNQSEILISLPIFYILSTEFDSKFYSHSNTLDPEKFAFIFKYLHITYMYIYVYISFQI